MKKIALLALVASVLAFAEGLIVNGDFEQGLEHWNVPSWIKNAATPELDSAEKPNGGKASLKLLGADGKLPIVFQGIKFLPGVRKYQVSYQIKTENMNDWGYVILYVSNDKNAKRYYSQTVGAGKGRDNSRPWQRYTAVMEVPEDADGARGKVFISFGGKTSGTAWIDDFVIEPEGSAAPKKAEEPAPNKAEEKKVESILPNGLFEAGLDGWIVPSWIKNAATPELDSAEIPVAGRASLKLVAADGKLPIVYQQFKFLPGITKYQVSFQIKTENINNWGYVMLHVADSKTGKRYYSQTVGAANGVNNSRAHARRASNHRISRKAPQS